MHRAIANLTVSRVRTTIAWISSSETPTQAPLCRACVQHPHCRSFNSRSAFNVAYNRSLAQKSTPAFYLLDLTLLPSVIAMGYTVQVNNVSSRATARDLQNFFSFSGRISKIDLRSDGNWSQVALVTFKDAEALDTAVLLSGATIVDQPISVFSLEDADQEVGWEEQAVQPVIHQASSNEAVTRAQDMMTSMLSKGYILGKDALSKAKSFDERLQLSANATSKVASFKKKIGLADKLNQGASAVNMTIRSVNDKYQITERTVSVYVYAHEGVKTAGTAIANTKLVQSGSIWVSAALYRVAKAAGDVTDTIKGRLGPAEAPKLRASA